MLMVIYFGEVLGYVNSYEEAEELAVNELGCFEGAELFLEPAEEWEEA